MLVTASLVAALFPAFACRQAKGPLCAKRTDDAKTRMHCDLFPLFVLAVSRRASGRDWSIAKVRKRAAAGEQENKAEARRSPAGYGCRKPHLRYGSTVRLGTSLMSIPVHVRFRGIGCH